MAKSSTVIALIKSLSKAEKRQFRLFSSLQKGAKDYLRLFIIVERGAEGNKVKDTFKKAYPAASYEMAIKHLYKVLTDCLLQLRLRQSMNTSLISEMLKANILFEKSLYESGFDELKKINTAAQKYEQYNIQLWVGRMELYYLSNLNFHSVTETELIKKQMKVKEILRYASNLQQHHSLYEMLRHRLVYKGHVRTSEQKKELNDLVVSEMNIISNPLADTFESNKIHLLFQAHYFITINDYKSALKLFYELDELFNKHRYLWIDSPIDYLTVIEGILESLRSIRQYDGMQFFLKQLQKLHANTVYFQIMLQRVIYVYGLTALIDFGEFKKAEKFKNNFDESFLKKLEVLDSDKQASVYLYTALIYFGNNNMNKAHYYLSKILLQSKTYYNLPFYQTFRLINLLVHYELGNEDFIFHEIRSVIRKFKSTQRKTYKVEKIIFSFLQLSITHLAIKERTALWQKFKAMFDQVIMDKYEMQLLQIFDFAGWIEARLCRKSFETILKDKFRLPETA